jgi:hypothetical protein
MAYFDDPADNAYAPGKPAKTPVPNPYKPQGQGPLTRNATSAAKLNAAPTVPSATDAAGNWVAPKSNLPPLPARPQAVPLKTPAFPGGPRNMAPAPVPSPTPRQQIAFGLRDEMSGTPWPTSSQPSPSLGASAPGVPPRVPGPALGIGGQPPTSLPPSPGTQLAVRGANVPALRGDSVPAVRPPSRVTYNYGPQSGGGSGSGMAGAFGRGALNLGANVAKGLAVGDLMSESANQLSEAAFPSDGSVGFGERLRNGGNIFNGYSAPTGADKRFGDQLTDQALANRQRIPTLTGAVLGLTGGGPATMPPRPDALAGPDTISPRADAPSGPDTISPRPGPQSGPVVNPGGFAGNLAEMLGGPRVGEPIVSAGGTYGYPDNGLGHAMKAMGLASPGAMMRGEAVNPIDYWFGSGSPSPANAGPRSPDPAMVSRAPNPPPSPYTGPVANPGAPSPSAGSGPARFAPTSGVGPGGFAEPGPGALMVPGPSRLRGPGPGSANPPVRGGFPPSPLGGAYPGLPNLSPGVAFAVPGQAATSPDVSGVVPPDRSIGSSASVAKPRSPEVIPSSPATESEKPTGLPVKGDGGNGALGSEGKAGAGDVSPFTVKNPSEPEAADPGHAQRTADMMKWLQGINTTKPGPAPSVPPAPGQSPAQAQSSDPQRAYLQQQMAQARQMMAGVPKLPVFEPMDPNDYYKTRQMVDTRPNLTHPDYQAAMALHQNAAAALQQLDAHQAGLAESRANVGKAGAEKAKSEAEASLITDPNLRNFGAFTQGKSPAEIAQYNSLNPQQGYPGSPASQVSGLNVQSLLANKYAALQPLLDRSSVNYQHRPLSDVVAELDRLRVPGYDDPKSEIGQVIGQSLRQNYGDSLGQEMSYPSPARDWYEQNVEGPMASLGSMLPWGDARLSKAWDLNRHAKIGPRTHDYVSQILGMKPAQFDQP